MALVYPHTAPQDHVVMGYAQRMEQSLANAAIATSTTDCNTVQGLSYYDSTQLLYTAASSEYLSNDNSLVPSSSVAIETNKTLLLHYSSDSNGSVYRHHSDGLDSRSLTSSSADEVCLMMESSINEASMLLQGIQPQQSLNWQAFRNDTWFTMWDPTLQEIGHEEVTSGFSVEADKGFNFSQWDESFVCQKKNHFQISIQIRFSKVPKYVKTNVTACDMEIINYFSLHLYGIKFEASECIIPIEQSRTDRSKLPYDPIIIDLPNFSDQLVKASACRLHFSETTSNNMRKRGKPNPDQRFFALVVALHADTSTSSYPVVAYASERIIVRASNPGQFDNEGDSTWLKGTSTNSDVVFYQGKVGINTETPEEALAVVGNVQITGQILQPSDVRLKTDIKEINTKKMLDNVQQLRLYSYSFKSDVFSVDNENPRKNVSRKEVGLLAQEVETILPDAVQTSTLNNEKNILLLNKDRLLMECIGAIQELDRKQRKGHHTLAVCIVIIFIFVASNFGVFIFHCFF